MAPVPDPPAEAVDCVAYLNEAWTPYHAVLASCARLRANGFTARPLDRRARDPVAPNDDDWIGWISGWMSNPDATSPLPSPVPSA